MTVRKGMLLTIAATVAVVLNIVLFASAALLSRGRPVRDVAIDPVSVSLVTLKPPTPPPPEKKREIPKPKPKPRLDFTPELARPSRCKRRPWAPRRQQLRQVGRWSTVARHSVAAW